VSIREYRELEAGKIAELGDIRSNLPALRVATDVRWECLEQMTEQGAEWAHGIGKRMRGRLAPNEECPVPHV
jgi:hypothetical protein